MSSLVRGGSTTTVPFVDRPVEMWICQLTPCTKCGCMLNYLYLVPRNIIG